MTKCPICKTEGEDQYDDSYVGGPIVMIRPCGSKHQTYPLAIELTGSFICNHIRSLKQQIESLEHQLSEA